MKTNSAPFWTGVATAHSPPLDPPPTFLSFYKSELKI